MNSRTEEQTLLWRASCAINACFGGDPNEPLCSRVWRQPNSLWRTIYVRVIDRCFFWREKHLFHCQYIHLHWLTLKYS